MNERIRKLDDAILRDPSLGPQVFKLLSVAQRELGLVHGDRPTCPFLRPHILSRLQYEEIKSATETVAHALEKVANEALENENVMDLLCLSPMEKSMARVDPGYRDICITSRLDSYLTSNGFRFLEYNAENPAGVGDQMQLEKVLFRLPALRSFLDTNRHWLPQPHQALLKTLLKAYREWGGEEQTPHIAIVDWHGVPTSSEFRILQEYFVECGYPTVIADPGELWYDGDRLFMGDFAIDIIYKRVLIHEFLDRFGLEHPLVRAYKARRVFMANSFRSKLAHKKSSFAVLTDPVHSHIFEPDELEAIRKHVPWTRLVKPSRTILAGIDWNLLDLVSEYRDEFVLKPNDDYGGNGVLLGWETDPEEWKAALKLAQERPYVVQQRVRGEKTSIPRYTDRVSLDELFIDFNPFLFRNEVEGALIRLSGSALMNVSLGGGQTALVVLDD